jgi:hypothetical protein
MSEKRSKKISTDNLSSLEMQQVQEIIQLTLKAELEQQQTSLSLAVLESVRGIVRKEISSYQNGQTTTNSYKTKLQATDEKVSGFIQQAISETARAYRLTVNSYIFSHIAAFLVLVAGLALIFISNGAGNLFPVAAALILGSILWIITLQNRNPVKNSRYMVNHLAKLNVIFAGYIRQIHQVDAVFEEIIGNGRDFTHQEAEQLLSNLQDAMSDAMSAISGLTEINE